MKKCMACLCQALLIGNLAVTFSLIGYRLMVGPAAPRAETARNTPSPVPSATSPVLRMGAKEASKHLLAQDAMFVDVRPLAAFKEANIPTSYSLPAERELSDYDMKRLKERPLLIVYGPDQAAQAVATKLAAKGLKVVILQDGLEGWRAAGMPVTKAVPALQE